MDSETTHSTALYDLLGWLDTHKKQLIQAAGGLAAIAVIVSFFVWRSNQKEEEAANALIVAQMDAGRAGSSGGEALKRFAADNESTKAGTYALLLAGGTLFTDGKYAEARSCFEQFLAKTSDSPFAVQASYGVASSLEAEGKLAEALVKYEDISKLSREPLADRAKLAMARILISQNKPTDAFKLYDQMAGTPSPAQGEAQHRAGELLKQHPELAPTNSPALAPIK